MLLDVEGLGFSYGRHKVLDGISFSVGDGEVVALLGPNGVGKSTMFRCILGFLSGYSGSIKVQGMDIGQLDPKSMAKRVAYIPQISSPVFDFTVLELCMMGFASKLSVLASPDADNEEQAMEVLDSLGIAHLAHSGTESISGGEYQLVLLARALLQEAPLLVMDEPTANLDYGNQFRIMQRIAELSGRGFSVILSAHDPNQVLMHATRVLVVKEGMLLADGRPVEVMTPELLSSLYRIDVGRADIEEENISLCYPKETRRARANDGSEGNCDEDQDR